MESLLHLDQQFFFFINRQLENPFFDFIMPYVREKNFWIPLYVLLLIYLVWRFKKLSWAIMITALLTVVITDQVSSSVIKPFVQRLRPCNDPLISSQVHLLVNCGSGFSFVSSHAANHFGIACFVIVLLHSRFRWIAPAALLWAALVSFAQIYVGVHYPVDTICGALLGIATGTITGRICRNILEKNNPQAFA
ncbi:MAG TPA: phosphatase PAP2 family protein [Chitinophagales bacterium]|nr:phosphatase PAP2 family protein [Chitinophagales bacterium]